MSKELVEKKNDLITRAEEILNTAKEEKRELTAEEAEQIREIKESVDRISETLELTDAFEAMHVAKKEEAMPEEEHKRSIEEIEERAFEAYLRNKVLNERNDVNLTVGDNGAVVPETIANRIIKHVYDVAPVLQRSTKYNLKGTLEIPYYGTDADHAGITVAYQSEFSPLASTNGKFSSISLTGYLAGALSKISMSLINNAKFNIVDFVVKEMGDNIARFIEKELLIGTVSKVAGLSGITQSVTTAAANVIKADDLISVQDSIKQMFQADAIWVMNPATLTAVRQLKTSDGIYLLNSDLTTEFGYRLLGKPVYVSDNMPAIAASASVIYYGDMKCLATKFSEEMNVQVLREKYADEHAVGVIGWFEFDSKVQDAQGLSKLVMHG